MKLKHLMTYLKWQLEFNATRGNTVEKHVRFSNVLINSRISMNSKYIRIFRRFT